MTYFANHITALADPTRRQVFEMIVARPRSVVELTQLLPVSQSAVSQHLKVLKDAELVCVERAGTRRIYRADGAALGELKAYIDEMWKTALASFSEAAENNGEDQ
jgi:DNA-binding transcriptional ArsR family regulator